LSKAARHGGQDLPWLQATSALHERASARSNVPAHHLHQSRQLSHCIKPDYINPNINIKLYDYIKLRARSSSSSTSPTQIISKVYIHMVFAAAALDQKLPPP
jgi:hypothetical protein